MDVSNYFKEDLIMFLEGNSKQEVFEKIVARLNKNGWVKDTYLDAVVKREEVYPTGLQAETLGVAIPHTDHMHVNEEVIAVGLVKNPVKFVHMGTEDMEVDVSIVFMLAIKKPDNQLGILQVITEIIQKKENLEKLASCSTQKEALNIIFNLLNNQTDKAI